MKSGRTFQLLQFRRTEAKRISPGQGLPTALSQLALSSAYCLGDIQREIGGSLGVRNWIPQILLCIAWGRSLQSVVVEGKRKEADL